ncbi:hypothetical protein [Kribbella sp. NPDC051620]|uniref:hypothetical protein n=1 Tax=Kribbella sp. NPDC051620 TaxID=3364120 RepID=UPI00378F6F17
MTGRKLFRTGLALAGVAALTTAALAAPAQAAKTSATSAAAACRLSAGSVTAAGAQTTSTVGGLPPVKTPSNIAHGVYQPGKVRVSSYFISEPNIAGLDIFGYVLQGDGLYSHSYSQDGTGEIDTSTPNSLTRIGGGWTNFKALETSVYIAGNAQRHTAYGLRSDGTLFRWNTSGGSWRSTGSTAGFPSVKSMALIGKTATYDTFLANLSGGALYTIKIPATTPMKPIVTKVRPSGWGGFEKLIANKCGASGTLLLGIDQTTKSGYTYAVSHANGTATVIQNLGKVNGTFPDPVNFRWGVVADLDPLTGG